MPRQACVKTAAREIQAPDPVFEIIKVMQVPMIEARAFMNALYLMEYGMNEFGCDDGDTVQTLAGAARERLEIIDDAVIDLIQIAPE